MNNLKDIINANMQRIKNDLKEIPNLKNIDCIDIFPTSEEHKYNLDKEIKNISKLLKETERGNIYLLNEPITTEYGLLDMVKIRFFDETRLKWEAAADFEVDDRDVLMKRVGKDDRYSYIKRDEWDAIEFKTDNTLIYFLKPLASEVYNRKV